MTLRIERVVTSGTFSLDGEDFAVDNNISERTVKPVAIGRKNWLFSGSMAGAHRAAVIYSLVQSCRLVNIDPFVYIRDVLLRVASHPQSRIAELTPKGWAERMRVAAAYVARRSST